MLHAKLFIAKADRLEAGGFNLLMENEIFNLSLSEDGEVGVWMENQDNTLPMVKLARYLDSVLATRQLDAHFRHADAPQ